MQLNPRVRYLIAQLDAAHLGLLRECLDFPIEGGEIFCGEWIRHRCEQKNIPFHQGWLRKLATLGLLERLNTSRGGSRRYYRIND
jgi:hypothetical protein